MNSEFVYTYLKGITKYLSNIYYSLSKYYTVISLQFKITILFCTNEKVNIKNLCYKLKGGPYLLTVLAWKIACKGPATTIQTKHSIACKSLIVVYA